MTPPFKYYLICAGRTKVPLTVAGEHQMEPPFIVFIIWVDVLTKLLTVIFCIYHLYCLGLFSLLNHL